MTRRNITVQIEEDVIHRAKVLAARRGTSVSALVGQQLEDLVEAEARYEDAWRRARKAMGDAADRGGRTWHRDQLHER
jgi:hypothetical protein